MNGDTEQQKVLQRVKVGIPVVHPARVQSEFIIRIFSGLVDALPGDSDLDRPPIFRKVAVRWAGRGAKGRFVGHQVAEC